MANPSDPPDTTYGSTDPDDPDYDPALPAIKTKYGDKPVSLQNALISYQVEKVLADAIKTADAKVTTKKRDRRDGSKDKAKETFKPVAIRLKEQGMSDKDIAVIIGRGRSTITGWLNEMSD